MLLTGASRGLGRIVARAFDEAGARLVLVSRTAEDLHAVAAELRGRHLVFSGDVRDPEFSERVVDHAVGTWGGLDACILNAGISPVVGHPARLDPEVWKSVIDVNLNGVFYGARAAARVLTRGGRIIITGSVLGERPHAGLCAYSASKAGIIGLTKALAVDLGPAGVTVNAVAPGWFESPLAEAWMRDERQSARIVDHTSLGRWGHESDLAGAYLFLASEAAAYVTGTVLSVDGGYLLA